ncbi:MAG: hypothetical protein Ct9H300mP28_04500 [Pseudomonadota bacterium]|nr:MAG: hypothetical protein Ct9H300mP28_04500 [Pseudomonadota bacterium]
MVEEAQKLLLLLFPKILSYYIDNIYNPVSGGKNQAGLDSNKIKFSDKLQWPSTDILLQEVINQKQYTPKSLITICYNLFN